IPVVNWGKFNQRFLDARAADLDLVTDFLVAGLTSNEGGARSQQHRKARSSTRAGRHADYRLQCDRRELGNHTISGAPRYLREGSSPNGRDANGGSVSKANRARPKGAPYRTPRLACSDPREVHYSFAR